MRNLGCSIHGANAKRYGGRTCAPCAAAHQVRRTALGRIDIHERAKLITYAAIKRDNKLGLESDMHWLWVLERLKAGICEVTGIAFDLGKTRDQSRNPFGPSLDRIDNTKPHTRANCQLVVWIYNAAKNDATHADVMRLARALVERGQ